MKGKKGNFIEQHCKGNKEKPEVVKQYTDEMKQWNKIKETDKKIKSVLILIFTAYQLKTPLY